MSNNIFNFTMQGSTYNVLDFSEIRVTTGTAADGKEQFPRHYLTMFQHIAGTKNYEVSVWTDNLVKQSYADGTWLYQITSSWEDEDWTENPVMSAEEVLQFIKERLVSWSDEYSDAWTYGDFGECMKIELTHPVKYPVDVFTVGEQEAWFQQVLANNKEVK